MLRLVALAAVALGVVLLAAAAFVLSYEGIHHIALRAGLSPGLAKLYPLIFDVMLVVAGAAALALRGAGWWPRCYAWGSLLIVLTAMAVGNAVHATGATLPAHPTKIAVAVTPWVLLLMAFGLLLELLRHFRRTRSNASIAVAGAAAPGAAVAGTVAVADVNGGPRTAATQATVSGTKARELPRVDLDTLLGPKAGEPPVIAILHGIGTGQNDGHQVDPVSYGEETGYVHPDSYLDEGEYSPHGDTGGPGRPDRLAGDTTGGGAHLASHDAAPAEALATTAEAPDTAAAHPTPPAAALDGPETARTTSAASAGAPATSAEPAATPAAVPATATEPLFTPAAAPATPTTPAAAPTAAETPTTPAAAPTAAETPATPAAASATARETPATPAAGSATATEPLFTPAAASATAAEPLFTPVTAPATAAETSAATPTEPSATPAEPSATPAEPPATPAELPEAAAETPAATAAPVGVPAAEAASGTENGQAAGGSPAGAGTPVGQEAMAEAGQGSTSVQEEAAGTEAPTLERIRSTPTPPEE
jgi:uncharacterized protein DUF2637